MMKKLIFLVFVAAWLFNVTLQLTKQESESWTCTSFFINDKGYLATAGHCVEGAKRLSVNVAGGNYSATLEAVDYDNDVAIIHIDHHTDNFFKLNPNVKVNDKVFILGYPVPSYTGYRLKSIQSKIVGVWSTQHQLAPGTCQGNSGGPVINQNNAVVGVLVAGYGSPCAYYSLDSKVSNVIDLAIQNGIDVYLDNVIGTMSEKDILNKDINNVVLLSGEG